MGALEDPPYAGHMIWVGVLVLLLTIAPLIKYFNFYRWTWDMIAWLVAGHLLLYIAAIVHFVNVLESATNELVHWNLVRSHLVSLEDCLLGSASCLSVVCETFKDHILNSDIATPGAFRFDFVNW